MNAVAPTRSHEDAAGFRHEALLYADDGEYVAGTVPFVRAGVEAGEPVLVAVPARRLALLREALGDDARHVHLVDMGEMGANPAWIIPAWRAFVSEHAGAGSRARGIGEPIWADRTPDELVECQRHESLLNVAFVDAAGFELLCPYDTTALPGAVVEEARRSHPFVRCGPAGTESADYRGLDASSTPLDAPLPEPPVAPEELSFRASTLHTLRRIVSEHARQAGLSAPRTRDVVLAVTELAANSVRHGGGGGHLRIWHDGGALVCEIRDAGHIGDPLAGRVRPEPGQVGGLGLWLVHQLCDLVQIRALPGGSVVRLHVHAA